MSRYSEKMQAALILKLFFDQWRRASFQPTKILQDKSINTDRVSQFEHAESLYGPLQSNSHESGFIVWNAIDSDEFEPTVLLSELGHENTLGWVSSSLGLNDNALDTALAQDEMDEISEEIIEEIEEKVNQEVSSGKFIQSIDLTAPKHIKNETVSLLQLPKVESSNNEAIEAIDYEEDFEKDSSEVSEDWCDFEPEDSSSKEQSVDKSITKSFQSNKIINEEPEIESESTKIKRGKLQRPVQPLHPIDTSRETVFEFALIPKSPTEYQAALRPNQSHFLTEKSASTYQDINETSVQDDALPEILTNLVSPNSFSLISRDQSKTNYFSAFDEPKQDQKVISIASPPKYVVLKRSNSPAPLVNSDISDESKDSKSGLWGVNNTLGSIEDKKEGEQVQDQEKNEYLSNDEKCIPSPPREEQSLSFEIQNHRLDQNEVESVIETEKHEKDAIDDIDANASIKLEPFELTTLLSVYHHHRKQLCQLEAQSNFGHTILSLLLKRVWKKQITKDEVGEIIYLTVENKEKTEVEDDKCFLRFCLAMWKRTLEQNHRIRDKPQMASHRNIQCNSDFLSPILFTFLLLFFSNSLLHCEN